MLFADWLRLIAFSCVSLAVNQTASAIPKTWRKPNEGISAGDAPQKEEEVTNDVWNWWHFFVIRWQISYLLFNSLVRSCHLFLFFKPLVSYFGTRHLKMPIRYWRSGQRGWERRGKGTMWAIVQVENVPTCEVEEADINDLGVLLSSENDSEELSIIFIALPAHCM